MGLTTENATNATNTYIFVVQRQPPAIADTLLLFFLILSYLDRHDSLTVIFGTEKCRLLM